MTKSGKHKGDDAHSKPVGLADTTREKLANVTGMIDGNPLAALLAGIAVGAAAGVLVPRSDREKALLAPLGGRISDAVQAALVAGREAGNQALVDSGLTVDGVREQVSTLFSHAADAARVAGGAAVSAAREKTSS